MPVHRRAEEAFRGSAGHVHASKLPDGVFQADSNGDRTNREGSWRPRRGMRRTNVPTQANALEAVAGFEMPDGRYGFVTAHGAVVAGYLAVAEQGAAVSLAASINNFSTNHRTVTAEYMRRMYFTDGWTKVRRWDGTTTTFEAAGITGPSQTPGTWTTGPSAAGATGMTVGDHDVRYRYKDSRTGWVSDPSETRTITVAAGALTQTFAIGGAGDIVAPTGTADTLVVEATRAGPGTVFFVAAEAKAAATTVALSRDDASLQAYTLPWPDDGHTPTPIGKYLVSHRERMWVFGNVDHRVGTVDVTNGSASVVLNSADPGEALGVSANDVDYVTWQFEVDGDGVSYEVDYYDKGGTGNLILKSNYGGSTDTGVSYRIYAAADVLWVSQAGYPESFAPLTWINAPNGTGAGDLVAGVGYSGVMLFFTRRGIFKLSWNLDPTVDGVWTQLDDKRGALNQYVVISVEGTVYAMDATGVHRWRGSFAQHISRPVDELLEALDYTKEDTWSAVWLPTTRAIRWYVTSSSATLPDQYFQFDVDHETWSTGSHDMEIGAAGFVPLATGPVPILGDENGHTWIADTGTCDGCVASESHLVTKATLTRTSIPVNETLGTDNVGLAGCFAYWVEGDEAVLIDSNTADTLTLNGTGYSSAPSVADNVWVGRIVSTLKTRAFVARSAPWRAVKAHRYLWLYFAPLSSTRYARLRVYEDYSASARASDTSSSQNDRDGIVWPSNTTLDRSFSDEWQLNLALSGGTIKVGLGTDRVRALSIELYFDEPDVSDFELLGIELESREGERKRE